MKLTERAKFWLVAILCLYLMSVTLFLVFVVGVQRGRQMESLRNPISGRP